MFDKRQSHAQYIDKSNFMICPGAIISLLVSLLLCALVISIIIVYKSNIETLTMEQTIIQKGNKIRDVISRLMYKTYMLSAIIDHEKDTVDNFERVAATIVGDGYIKNVAVAPNGVVSKIYPLFGNEILLGRNLLVAGASKELAKQAEEKGMLVFGGPFTSPQRDDVLIGILPIYSGIDNEENRFWGLVVITLKYPAILEEFDLHSLALLGLTYELWWVNPDNREKIIIASSSRSRTEQEYYIEKNIPIFNAEWHLRIGIKKGWYEYTENLLMALIGIFISILIAFIVQKSYKLQILTEKLERLAHIDALTGVYNRHYFVEYVTLQIEKIKRNKSNGFIVMFDLDFFKKINDTYGHTAGDEVLRVVPSRIRLCIRPYDILARFGGEEFIIFIQQIDMENVCNIVERCRIALEDKPILYEGRTISVTASFGIAELIPEDGINIAVVHADEALYSAKKGGRNRYSVYNPHSVADLL
ncbi:MAG: sensor domain-containing diguanylate cyclase [Tannerella sp.]|jgi:diguanylate cyclase (GGDEF)-like protein|nr:sensor domain-containing diguanylate cyclase [Tannerella sp.]